MEIIVDELKDKLLSKNVMAIILALLTAFIAPPIVEEVTDDTPAPAVALDCPDQVVVGELVRMTYAARRVEWTLPGDDYEIDEQRAWISFREPGTYQVIVSGLVDNDVRSVTKNIEVVRGSVSVLVPETVDFPDQENEPDEEYVPVPMIQPFATDLTAKVEGWCVDAKVSTDVAEALGQNFIDAASTTDNKSDLMRSVANKNKETNQKGAEGVLVKVQVWMIENLSDKDFDEHQCAVSDVGMGFLNYAKSN